MRDAGIDPGFSRPRQRELLGASQRNPHQRGDQASQRNSPRSHLSPRCNRHFRAMTSTIADGAVATKATRGLRGAFRCLPPINARLGCGSVWIYVLNSALAASRERLHISRMAHLAQKILRKVIHAAAVVALLTGVASAQSLMPGLNLSGDKPPLTPQEEEKRKAIEDSYKSALKKIPDKQKSVDPWENIRPNPSTSPKTKQGQQ